MVDVSYRISVNKTGNTLLSKFSSFLLISVMLLTILFLSGCNSEYSDIVSNDGLNHETTDNVNTDINSSDVNSDVVKDDVSTVSRDLSNHDAIIIDHTNTNPEIIPKCWIDNAKSDLKIAYAHTSHGSQIISGMNALYAYDSKYSYNSNGDEGALHLEDYYGGYNGASDLSAGETSWYSATRKFLNDKNNQEINVIVWSWCSIAGHDVENNYLDNVAKLIKEYGAGSSSHPTPVKFVLMTGHAEGGGINDASDSRNKLIRDFCNNLDNCILFDFADIENYDPKGNYYLNKRITDNLDYDCKAPYDGGGLDCNWAKEYLHDNPSSISAKVSEKVGDCAHSQSLTCALKGQAAWSLWARISGWNGNSDQKC